ncbi:MAG: redox-regulated ATPase YchF [bacterium]|nr:redox-regulated ATPase YchF [bacterium]
MSLAIGIIGLPNVGKSTLFQALTKKEVDRSNSPFATLDPNIGVVEVPDERLKKLAEFSNSKKTVPAIVQFVDIAGLVKGAAEGEGLGNKFLSHIREVDAILEVVRAFPAEGGSASGGEDIIHIYGNVNPERDIAILETELALKDLETAEKVLPRFEKETKANAPKAGERLETLKNLAAALKKGVPASKDARAAEISKELSLLTSKPILYCFNINSANPPASLPRPGLALDLKREIEAPSAGLPNLISEAYRVLKLITFFTTGEDETRAWTIPQNSKATRAGRAIHGDFEEKFIKAAVISCASLLASGSWAEAKAAGLIRTEGKDYPVRDGDVIEFKI